VACVSRVLSTPTARDASRGLPVPAGEPGGGGQRCLVPLRPGFGRGAGHESLAPAGRRERAQHLHHGRGHLPGLGDLPQVVPALGFYDGVVVWWACSRHRPQDPGGSELEPDGLIEYDWATGPTGGPLAWLYHTFEGACNKNGDRVDDTRRSSSRSSSASSATAAPAEVPGSDRSTFMDYVDDACMDQFTGDQHKRMRKQWTSTAPAAARCSACRARPLLRAARPRPSAVISEVTSADRCATEYPDLAGVWFGGTVGPAPTARGAARGADETTAYRRVEHPKLVAHDSRGNRLLGDASTLRSVLSGSTTQPRRKALLVNGLLEEP
jgi:hypothetical protein